MHCISRIITRLHTKDDAITTKRSGNKASFQIKKCDFSMLLTITSYEIRMRTYQFLLKYI